MQIELTQVSPLEFTLTLSQREAELVADALDAVNPDFKGQTRLARDMAFAIDTFIMRFRKGE